MKFAAICLMLLLSAPLYAQNSQTDSIAPARAKPRNYFGVRFGGTASSFSRDGKHFIPTPGQESVLSWHAGLAMDMFTRRFYNARVEVSYVNKGARETFAGDRIDIESINRLGYAQVSLLPLVIRPGFKKVNPYIALGGYYARGVSKKSKWKPGANAGWQDDAATASNLNIEQDFGYSVSIGMYVYRRPLLEVRYEGGLKSVSPVRDIRNRSLIVSVSI